MNARIFSGPRFRMSAIALAGALLFGCGGGSDTATVATELPASVRVSETATALSVRTTLAAGSTSTSSEVQSLLYAFSATITGPDARLALTGTLVLKGERDDDGSLEVEGRLLPSSVGVATAAPSDTASAAAAAELQARLDAQRAALKSALRADVEALSATLKLALANGVAGSAKEPSAAQREALATFKAAFNERVAQYRADLSALSPDESGGLQAAHASGDGDRKRARGYAVEGTIDAQGVVNLTISLGDKGKVLVTGSMAADGSLSGTLSGPTSTDFGTRTAQAVGAPPPPPPPPPPPTGTFAAGQTKYDAACASCHKAGAYDPNGPFNDLKGKGSLLVSNLGAISGGMNGLTLTAQEILDLQAFLSGVQ